MTLPKRDTQYHIFGDYLVWSGNSGDELIDGTAYIKEPPSPTVSHQTVVGEIYRQIANLLKGTPWRVFVAPVDVRLPKSRKIPVYERAGVPEVWLIDLSDRTVTIYRLREGRYGPQTVLKLTGQTQLAAVPQVIIDWDELVAEIPVIR